MSFPHDDDCGPRRYRLNIRIAFYDKGLSLIDVHLLPHPHAEKNNDCDDRDREPGARRDEPGENPPVDLSLIHI